MSLFSCFPLRDGFLDPPRDAGPCVYWFWFENVVTKEEISRDLQEMSATRIAGAELRSVSIRGSLRGAQPERETPP